MARRLAVRRKKANSLLALLEFKLSTGSPLTACSASSAKAKGLRYESEMETTGTFPNL
jgi:hypothetical protein